MSKQEETKKKIIARATRQRNKYKNLFKQKGDLTLKEAIAVIVTLDLLLEVGKTEVFELMENIEDL